MEVLIDRPRPRPGRKSRFGNVNLMPLLMDCLLRESGEGFVTCVCVFGMLRCQRPQYSILPVIDRRGVRTFT